MTQTNSRFITPPDTVYPDSNHTVVLVDATPEDIEKINYFCNASNKNYDIYLYKGDYDDLQWLGAVTNLADHVLINESSQVTISGIGNQSKFSLNVLEYFQKFDDNSNQL